MGKEQFKIEGTVERKLMVDQIRRGARQFAMLYFHFCYTLYKQFGMEKTKELVRQSIFELAVDRSDQMRERAAKEGIGTDTLEDFRAVTDLPKCGWIPEWGKDHCPYGEIWRSYFEKYPWFQELAPFYCDVIDTTTIENYTRRLSHKILQNVMFEGESCERTYFESDSVKEGVFTYGSKEEI